MQLLWTGLLSGALTPPLRVASSPTLVPRRGRHADAPERLAEGSLVQCPTPGCNTPLRPGRLAAHLLNCPVLAELRELESSGYYFRGINMGQSKDDGDASPPSASALDIDLEVSVRAAHVTALASELLHSPSSVPDPGNMTMGVNARKRESHRVQRRAIVDIIAELGVLGHGHCLIEVGAGNGELSNAIEAAFPGQLATDAVILLDNSKKPRGRSGHGRLSADVQLAESCAIFHRVKVGIEDVDLTALRDTLAPGRRIVVLAKHLCGAASDYALRAIGGSAGGREPPVAIVLGTCCHHRCEWPAYPARSYLRSLDFERGDFERICRLSSRGVNARDESARADAGRRAKDLIDAGRARYLRDAGYEAELRRYVDASVTPENVLIVASEMEKQ